MELNKKIKKKEDKFSLKKKMEQETYICEECNCDCENQLSFGETLMMVQWTMQHLKIRLN
jgi:hypothetical protein